MALNLKILVLRGSAVLLVGKAGNPRLGSGSAANPETPEIGISMRHPSRGGKQEFQPVWRLGHADYCRMDSRTAYGAGRSHRCADVLSRGRMRRTSGTATALRTAATTAVLAVVSRCLSGLAWCESGYTMRSALAG
ncbi:MAG: hypothetical protein ACYC3I_08415 [Gemmataceae bacterium]